MAATLEEEIKRKRAEEGFSDSSDSSTEDSSDREHKGDDYVLVPEAQVEQKPLGEERPPVVPPGHIDLGPPSAAPAAPPGHIDLAPPNIPGVQTDPETGTRYVTDKDTGRMVPHAELATEADKEAFKPGDVELPQVDVLGPPVPRAELVRLPTSPDEPMTPGPSGLDRVKPAPDTLPQVEKGELVPPRAQPVTPITEVRKAEPVAPPEAPKPVEQETTFMGMPILGREAALPETKEEPPPGVSKPGQPAPYYDSRFNNLQGDFAERADAWAKDMEGHGYRIRVIQDRRTPQEQQALYEAHLRGGPQAVAPQVSYHTYGRAFDYGFVDRNGNLNLNNDAGYRFGQHLAQKYGLKGLGDADNDHLQDANYSSYRDLPKEEYGRPSAERTSATAGKIEPGFISGRATTFGYHDPDDPGVGAPRLGKINTNEGSLVGVAVPEEALRAQVGASPAEWRKARVEIVTSDGRHMLVPIVDLGPGDVQQTKGIAADFTHGLATVLKHSDQNNYQFRIIPNAGVDVMKNPQVFVAEQAQLAKGVDLSPKAKGPAAAMGGYVLVPESEAQKAESAQAGQKDTQAQQDTLTALHEHSSNMPDWYHALEKPIPGVSDATRNATREEFKKQITAYAQDYYKESDPGKAFARIMSAPNLLTSAGEIITKSPAHIQHALIAWSRGLDANGENQIIDFINKVHPEATPEARAGFVREILSKPAGNERTRFVSALYSSVDPQITQGISLPTLLDSIDTISQPGYQEKRSAEINAAVAKNLKDLRTDPTMENTWGGTVSDAIAQMPKNLGEALFPVIGQSAMTSEIYFDTLDGLRKEHPDWSNDQLKAKAGAASVPQVILQEVVNLATMGLGGGLVKGITNPVARIAANSIVHGGIAGTAATVQQGVANWATGRPITEGMPQAGLAGGIQGMIGGAMHVPEARPRVPEATIGLKGGEIRGPTEETLTKTAPVTPESILGPDVPDTSMPWHKPPPIITRGEERTTFTPAELAEQASTLRGRTPEELTAAAEALSRRWISAGAACF